ncbi:ribosome silencing factor [Rivularia sp. UHCC 0363]|uniref:ribosome silencing factor n=1 Tax=Rivularia sp. UHCC 0363 TaxID=3110244 RepID=UPI002B202E30|nr:ribosome silencing factor [Rivularia sp. UHCC 0363]MEA5597704.1 ribosome silencing factor [Rivularia sp. UHCC 0363]
MSDYFQTNLQSEFVAVSNISIASQQLDTEDSSVKLALAIVEAGNDRQAGDMLLLDVKNVSYLADYFVVMTGYSNVQVRAIANTIEGIVEQKCDRKALRSEGKSEGSWVLIDYGDIIVHIMMPSEREFYNLEAFWGHAERVDIQVSQKSGGQPI